MDTPDWDDLRYLLAVARHGSAAAAARALQVTHATVLRRVQAAEQAFGLRVFERASGRFRVAEQARPLLEMAEGIERQVQDTRRQVAARQDVVEGTLRLTTTESLMDSLLPPLLYDFAQRHRGVVLELVVTNQVLDLDRHEADVTIRPAAEPPDTLVGLRLANLAFAVYGPKRDESPPGQDLAARCWLVPDGGLTHSPVGRWVHNQVAPKHVVLKADSWVVMRNMAEAGLGVAVLPCFLAERSAQLKRIADAPEAGSQLWILTHAEWRNSTRIKAFMDHLSKGIRKHRDLLEGKPQS
ncbi:MAG: LysR family transcriptional regulator [Burkholderiales bacterium]|nr:LysR family transcriptional regulator [Burkholderiales bacterium]